MKKFISKHFCSKSTGTKLEETCCVIQLILEGNKNTEMKIFASQKLLTPVSEFGRNSQIA